MQSDFARGALHALPFSIAAVLAYHLLSRRQTIDGAKPAVIQSPVDYVAALSKRDRDALPYPPDALPGGRDIDTPYGHIRAYEWGNEHGQKVLLVHGISTPSVSLASVAQGLVARGYRVLLFDLFGRGYSATPDPDTNPQTVQLFSSQIHFVLNSSPLSWTGASKFHLVGYSLGGGISMAFTSYFPGLVDSLVLIAPSGLVRQSRLSLPPRLIHSGFIPTSIARNMIRQRYSGSPAKLLERSGNPNITTDKAMSAEVPNETHPALKSDSSAPLFKDRPDISVADATAWQVKHNHGFVPAFVSSIQHAPIGGQHERWRIVGQRLAKQRSNPQDHTATRLGLRHGKVLMVIGETDDVIVGEELVPDAKEVVGEDGLHVVRLDAGHDLTVTKPDDVVESIIEFWER